MMKSNGYLARFGQIRPDFCNITIFLPESFNKTFFLHMILQGEFFNASKSNKKDLPENSSKVLRRSEY